MNDIMINSFAKSIGKIEGNQNHIKRKIMTKNKPKHTFYENGSGDIYMDNPNGQDYYMTKRKFRKGKWKIFKVDIKRCVYNVRKYPELLPIKVCGKKAKYYANIEDTETFEEFTHNFCKKHYKLVLECGNVSEGGEL